MRDHDRCGRAEHREATDWSHLNESLAIRACGSNDPDLSPPQVRDCRNAISKTRSFPSITTAIPRSETERYTVSPEKLLYRFPTRLRLDPVAEEPASIRPVRQKNRALSTLRSRIQVMSSAILKAKRVVLSNISESLHSYSTELNRPSSASSQVQICRPSVNVLLITKTRGLRFL